MIGKYFVVNKHLRLRTALDACIKTCLSLTTSATHQGRAVLLILPPCTLPCHPPPQSFSFALARKFWRSGSLLLSLCWQLWHPEKLKYKSQKGKRKENDRQGVKWANKFRFFSWVVSSCRFWHLRSEMSIWLLEITFSCHSLNTFNMLAVREGLSLYTLSLSGGVKGSVVSFPILLPKKEL